MAGKDQIAVAQLSKNASTLVTRAKAFWSGLSNQQKILLGAGAAITLAAIGFFIKMVASPDYKPLMTGLEPADAQEISSQLSAKKIPFVVGPDGTSIRVPASQLDAARLEIASHDAPHSGRIGFEIFDKVSWGQTEFDEKVNYQRALEGELERTIQTIRNVKSARVHLVMASDSVFLDRERGAKASVTLRLKHGSLSKEEVAQIARLVAGAVNELDPKDVTIIDADSNRSLGSQENAGAADVMEQQLTQRLIATLSPVVGADRIRASVNVEYENGSSEENQEKYDPNVSVVLNMQRSEETAGGLGAASGVPGTSSNVPNIKNPAAQNAAKDGSPSSRSESATYGVNKTTKHMIEPAGGIRRLTAAIVLDDAMERKQDHGKLINVPRKRTPEELKLINDLAQAAIGYNSARGDVVSVQNLSFDHGDALDNAPTTFVDKARQALEQFSWAIRYAVLLVMFILVYLLMIRPIQKRVLAVPTTPVLAHAHPAPALEIPETPVAALETTPNLAQRSLALKKELSEFVRQDPDGSTAALRTWLKEESQ